MLEIKDVCMSKGGKQLFCNQSFVVKEGEIINVTGEKGCGKTSLLLAIMGMLPIDSGYITVDGELLTVDSAETFRTLMAYLPQNLLLPYANISDLIEDLSSLKSNKKRCSKEQLMTFWGELGLDASLYDKNCSDVTMEVQRLIILSVFYFCPKPIVLVDEPMTMEECQLLRKISQQGSALIVTGQDNVCDKRLILKTEI
jgi:putative ABC transport system ATP-binding protein